MDLQTLTQTTMESAAKALLASKEKLGKAVVDMSTGLTGFNLEAPAKLLVPILAEFRQSIGRVTRPGEGTNWKVINAVTRTGAFKTTDGVRSNSWTFTKANKSTTYGIYGRLGDVTREGQIVGSNFEDLEARTKTLNLLLALQEEEVCILGGHTTNLGAGPTPTVTAAASGGFLADATYYVYLVPLTVPGSLGASQIARPATGNIFDCTTPPTLELVNGVGLPTAANTSGAVSGGSGLGKLTITWTWSTSAAAYAVYIGTSSGSANAKLQAIVTQSKMVVTVTNTTGAVPNTSDTSGNAPFEGIWGQLVANGGRVTRVNGALSAAVGRGIPEIDAFLDYIYDRVKEEPDRMVMGWQEHGFIDDKLAAVTSDRVKLNINVSGDTSSEVLPRFTTYKSKRGKVLKLEENANMPGGSILFLKDSVQIPAALVPSPWQMHMGQDLARLDYAMVNPKIEFEDRFFGALAGYVPGFQGLMCDIRGEA